MWKPFKKLFKKSKSSQSKSKHIVPSAPLEESEPNINSLMCTICMCIPQEPVLIQCGHIYCWPCLYQWMQQILPPREPTCPVCTKPFTRNQILPIYGGTDIDTTLLSSMSSIPPRPSPISESKKPQMDTSTFNNSNSVPTSSQQNCYFKFAIFFGVMCQTIVISIKHFILAWMHMPVSRMIVTIFLASILSYQWSFLLLMLMFFQACHGYFPFEDYAAILNQN